MSIDPTVDRPPAIFANLILKQETASSGTVSGLSADQAASSALANLDIILPPGGTYPYLIRRDREATSSTQIAMRNGLVLIPRVNSFSMTVNGKTLHPETEMATLMQRASRLVLLTPVGDSKVYYAVANGVSLVQVLEALKLGPKTDTGGSLIELMGRPSDKVSTGSLTKLYSDQTKKGAWAVESATPLASPIVAGNQIRIAFITNLDRIRESPPTFVANGSFTIPCGDAQTSAELSFPHSPALSSFSIRLSLWQSEDHMVMAKGPFSINPDPLAGTRFDTPQFNPAKDPNFFTWAGAKAKVMDANEHQIDLTREHKAIALSLTDNLSRVISSDRLFNNGTWELQTEPDGTGNLHFIVEQSTLTGQTASLPIDIFSLPVTESLGRSATIPPIPQHHAFVRGIPNWWDAAAYWLNQWPEQSYTIYPALRGVYSSRTVVPIVVDAATDSVMLDGKPASMMSDNELAVYAGDTAKSATLPFRVVGAQPWIIKVGTPNISFGGLSIGMASSFNTSVCARSS